MRIKSLLALAATFFIHLQSHADVVYEWKPVGNEPPHNIDLQLVFSEETVSKGSFSFHVPYEDWVLSYPESGLVSLFYQFPAPSFSAREFITMSYKPRMEQFRRGRGSLDMEVEFSQSGFLTGWIRANDSESDFEMKTSGLNFMQVIVARSDAGMDKVCDGQIWGCSGALGHIQQVHNVPEPGSLALLVAGGIVAVGARRKNIHK